MALFVFLLWVGSLVSGYFHFAWWLIAPFGFFVIHVLRSNTRMAMMAERNGLDKNRLLQSVSRANTMLIVTAILQHGAIFGIGWFVSYFFRN